MNTTKPVTHTPGPWHIGQSREWDDDGEPYDQLAIYSAEGVKVAKVETWLKHAREESEANAQLISLTPDLVNALRGMLNWAMRVKQHTPGLEIAIALNILAKAEWRAL